MKKIVSIDISNVDGTFSDGYAKRVLLLLQNKIFSYLSLGIHDM
jgi:hypothetical protein